ncbi:MAG: secondary thiamine-phosphate synthase enzyme YjbQ [Methanosarcinales archaeon]
MKTIKIQTKKETELLDITKDVREFVKEIKSGICVIFTKHTTTGIIINENENGLKSDILNLLNEIVQNRSGYLHDRIDNNARAHLRSILLGCSVTVPIENGNIALGTWQSIFLVECDGPRNREVYIKILEELKD